MCVGDVCVVCFTAFLGNIMVVPRNALLGITSITRGCPCYGGFKVYLEVIVGL